MAKTKTKAKSDPFLARPDGGRATSAWLTKLKTHAANTKTLPTNTLEANIDLVRSGDTGHSDAFISDWDNMLQWHGPGTFDHLAKHLTDKRVVKLVDSFRTDAAQALLLGKLNLLEVREAVLQRAERWPLYTLRGLLALNPGRDQHAAQLLQRLLYTHPEWLEPLQAALAAEGDEAQSRTLARLLASTEKVTEASFDELPALLRTPPWRSNAARVELPVLALTPRREPALVDWSRWRGGTVEPRPQMLSRYSRDDRFQVEADFLNDLDRVLREDATRSDDALVLSLLRQQSLLPVSFYEYGSDSDTRGDLVVRLLKRFGSEHIDAILPVMPHAATEAAQMIMEIVDSDALALHLLQYASYPVRNQLRTFARNWLLAHPQTSARVLIPIAFSADADSAAHARQHLCLLVSEGHAAVLRAQAQAYGAQAIAAVETLLATAAEAFLPAQLPKLPAWLVLPRLPRLLLASSGHAVPLTAMPDALMPLALSKGGVSYAGLDMLQAVVTPESLAHLMLGLFQQWLDNGMPPNGRWIFELQGRLGNDANARALAPRIREWRIHRDRVRSYEGLETLARIGSDTALMLLSSYCEQKRYGDLQNHAAKALARVAAERDLTLEQLADRTVPTLGLDERGRLQLDFGPRQFTASLDPDLLPQVHDEAGKRLKDLPKPGAKDDAELAKDAVADWKEFKKQAKLVASTQNVRLEAAMCGQRRWPLADFLAFFARHPVLRTLCQRLVWAAFDTAGAVVASFRVSEDLSLVDVDDVPYEPDATHCIGLPHVLELAQDLRSRWLALLADYEILQPFEQLARTTYTMTAEEMPLNTLPRYEDRGLSTGSLLGLEQRGWKRSIGDGGGMIDCLIKPLDSQHGVSISFDPGWFVSSVPNIEEEQGIRVLYLFSNAATTSPPAWGDLSAIVRSEMLRDLERLAWHTRD